ncbi:MAG: acetate kinase [Candidatus Nanopelagicales bacterium]
MRPVLVINSGSSSVKYALVDPRSGERPAIGLIERIGEAEGRISHRAVAGDGSVEDVVEVRRVADHSEAFALMDEAFATAGPHGPDYEPVAVGHRVVHGGDRFAAPALITPEVVAAIEACVPLAPLHNPANLLGIRAVLADRPGLPQVAVFDTAFHQSLAPAAYTYAVDRGTAEQHRIRRYGFHGTSHAYVSRAAAEYLRDEHGVPVESSRIVTLHLGNGASACAVLGGSSVDTSMGLTPLEGLVMGTRSGDLDPAVIPYLVRSAGLDVESVDALLNKRSGLLGLCGNNDMRTVLDRVAAGDAAATLALDVYVHRIRHYVGAYLAVLGGLDALVFTGGVGENAAPVRERVCAGWDDLGIGIDPQANAGRGAADGRDAGPVRDVSATGSRTRVLVVRTDEEREIAMAAVTVAGVA